MSPNFNIFENTCETALNKLKRKIPYGWDLNIFRGCQHGCKYCYAIYSHKYIEDANYFSNIYVKTNIVEILEKELKSKSWKREIINIGGVTDSYQQAEEKYKIMPEILKLLIRYKTPAIISTKSDLILRDFELIDKLSRITYINVAATITTTDENIRKKIEPFGCSSNKRFEVLKEFRKTNASTGIHVMPIIPFLTDDFENIEELCKKSNESKVHYFLPGMLYLRGETKKVFLEFVKNDFPEKAEKIIEMYKKGSADKDYKAAFYLKLNQLREKYKLSSSYTKPIKEKMYKDTIF